MRLLVALAAAVLLLGGCCASDLDRAIAAAAPQTPTPARPTTAAAARSQLLPLAGSTPAPAALQLAGAAGHELVPGGPGFTANGTVSAGNLTSFTFRYPQAELRTPRVQVELLDAHLQPLPPHSGGAHLDIAVSQPCGGFSWDLPLKPGDADCVYTRASREVCPQYDCLAASSNEAAVFSVQLASLSPSARGFRLRATLEDLLMPVNSTRTLTISPSSPSFLEFHFGQHEAFTIKVHSAGVGEDMVALVSLQNSSCPVYDLPSNVRFDGIYQSMTKQAVFHVTRETLGESAFVVLVPYPSDASVCEHAKNFEVTLSPTPAISTYAWPMAFVLVFYLVLPFGMYLLFISIERLRGKGFSEPEPEDLAHFEPLGGAGAAGHGDDDGAGVALPLLGRGGSGRGKDRKGRLTTAARLVSYGSTDDDSSVQTEPRAVHGAALGAINDDGAESSSEPATPRSPLVSQQSINALSDAGFEVIDALHLANSEWDDGDNYTVETKDFYRSQRMLRVNHLTRKRPKISEKKYKQYFLYLLPLLIFYALPVIQLVRVYLLIFDDGNQDICYYNFECARPLRGMFVFNNIYSNMGYVLLGLLFMLIVRRRSRLYNEKQGLVVRPPGPDQAVGLPRHYGIFYAIGLALIGEGVFSACYHTCPSATNFQFDTSCMYIIAGLNVLAIYQRRHSDALANPHVIYACFAACILLEVIGVYWSNVWFYACLLLTFTVGSYFVALNLFYLGMWRCDCSAPGACCDQGRNQGQADLPISSGGREVEGVIQPCRRWYTCGLPVRRPQRPARAFLVSCGLLITWSILIYGVIANPNDTPTFFLMLFMANFFAYLSFYCVMKLVHKEKITWLPIMAAIG